MIIIRQKCAIKNSCKNIENKEENASKQNNNAFSVSYKNNNIDKLQLEESAKILKIILKKGQDFRIKVSHGKCHNRNHRIISSILLQGTLKGG